MACLHGGWSARLAELAWLGEILFQSLYMDKFPSPVSRASLAYSHFSILSCQNLTSPDRAGQLCIQSEQTKNSFVPADLGQVRFASFDHGSRLTGLGNCPFKCKIHKQKILFFCQISPG